MDTAGEQAVGNLSGVSNLSGVGNLSGSNNLRTENGSSQGQNLALTGLSMPKSLLSGRAGRSVEAKLRSGVGSGVEFRRCRVSG